MNRNVASDPFLTTCCLSDLDDHCFVARTASSSPHVRALSPPTLETMTDAWLDTPLDDFASTLMQEIKPDAALVKPTNKRRSKRPDGAARAAKCPKVIAATHIEQQTAPSCVTKAAPWYAQLSTPDSIWWRDPQACAHRPEQDTWASNILHRQGETTRVIKDIHRMVAHLASASAPRYNSEIFRALVQIPQTYRSDIAEALYHVFQSPAAACASVRFQLLRKIPNKAHDSALHALQTMLPYANVTDADMFLHIFMAIRHAPLNRRKEILPQVAQYLQVSHDPTGRCVAPLLRSCLQMCPTEAIEFCHFLSHCHNVDVHSPQTYDFDTIRSATLVAASERSSFLALLNKLHRPRGFAEGATTSWPTYSSPFLAPLSRIDSILRESAVLAACEVFDLADDAARTLFRQQLLTSWEAPCICALMHDLRTNLPTSDARRTQFLSYSRAIAFIHPGMRSAAVESCLDTIAIGSANALTATRLQMLERFDMRRFGQTLYTAAQLRDAAERTLAVAGASVCGPELVELYFTFLCCPSEEQDSFKHFVAALACPGLSLKHQLCLVREGYLMGMQGRADVLACMAPFAFSPEHDADTSFRIFLHLAYLYHHQAHHDIAQRLQQWGAEALFPDVAPCAAIEVLFELQAYVVAHRQASLQLPRRLFEPAGVPALGMPAQASLRSASQMLDGDWLPQDNSARPEAT